MAQHASGSLRSLIYAREWKFGTVRTSMSGVAKVLRNTGDTLNMSKTANQSEELDGSRAIKFVRHGNQSVAGDVSFELAFADFDDLLAASVGGTWGTVAAEVDLEITENPSPNDTLVIGDTVFQFVAAGAATNNYDIEIQPTLAGTRPLIRRAIDVYSGIAKSAGDWQGDILTLVASTEGTWANTIPVSANLTEALDGFGNTHFDGGEDGDVLKQGFDLPTYTIQKHFRDIDQVITAVGCAVNTLNIEVATDSIVTGSFGFVGSGINEIDNVLMDDDVVPAENTEPFASYQGDIKFGNFSGCNATALSLNIDNGVTANYTICSNKAMSLGYDNVNVTGTITALFEDARELNKFIEEQATSLTLTLVDPVGNKYMIELPRIKYTGGETPVGDGGVVSISLPFQALYDATAKSTIVITRDKA